MASSDIEMGTGDEISYSRIPVEGRSRTTEEWKSTFVAKVEQSKSHMPNKCCIFKVPEVLQRQKKIAYQPFVEILILDGRRCREPPSIKKIHNQLHKQHHSAQSCLQSPCPLPPPLAST